MAGPTKYKNQWQKDNMDRVHLVMPKGQRDIFRAHADERGESLNAFAFRALREQMERDKKGAERS